MGSAFETQLLESMKFGFIDRVRFRDVTYAPKILINNAEDNSSINSLQQSLKRNSLPRN